MADAKLGIPQSQHTHEYDRGTLCHRSCYSLAGPSVTAPVIPEFLSGTLELSPLLLFLSGTLELSPLLLFLSGTLCHRSCYSLAGPSVTAPVISEFLSGTLELSPLLLFLSGITKDQLTKKLNWYGLIEALRRRAIHEDTLQDEESTQTKEDHDTSISQDPTDHYYSSIGDHDYTYIDNTPIAGRQDGKEERGSGSVTHGLDPSQTTEPMKSTLQDEEHGATMLVCWLRHIKVVATAIFVAALIVVGLLLVTGVLPPDVEKHASHSGPGTTQSTTTWPWKSSFDVTTSETTVGSGTTEIGEVSSNSSSKHSMSTTTAQTEMNGGTFDVEGCPRKVTVSTSGRIAVMFTGRRVGIYDSEGIFIMYFLTYMRKDGERQFAFSPTMFRLVPSPTTTTCGLLSNRAIVTETVEHRGAVKVFGLNGMLERSFGRRQGLMHPTGITVDSEDSILVLDYSTGYIYVYRDNGQFMFKFAGKGTNSGRLSLPLDICTDSSRHIIVADSGNRRVELFTSRGEFIRHIATDVEPLSIAVGPDGQLVLTEVLNKKVTILTNY
ncbi:hypothetical protein Bbelb_028410 [Branchiostoma belcheri]|nr:hypothetical protein Bbelb_028410 [Branchiostoma belcheri]